MKCLVLTGFFLLVFGSHLQAQEPSDIHQHTVAPSNARFEIVQSELAAKWTFRLDRVPEGPMRAYLRVIDREPEAVQRALRTA